jgi:superoxide dismutase, Fe-Mn family
MWLTGTKLNKSTDQFMAQSNCKKESNMKHIITFLSTLIVFSVAAKEAQQNVFKLPPLPYAYNALEPYIDARTMEFHHDKHHQKYVDELNAALKNYPDLRKKTVEELLAHLDELPAAVRTAVKNNGGGHANHSFFWIIMAPHAQKEPSGALKKALEKKFRTVKNFKTEFNNVASHIFGSGYAWLCVDPFGSLVIVKTANQDSPISQGLTPLLVLDVWEHSYYLKYQNKRADFIDAWWNVVNWKQVGAFYDKALKSRKAAKRR